MIRLGPPHGAEKRELQEIDGGGGWGTYKNDGKAYADLLGGTLAFAAGGKASGIGLSFRHNPSETLLRKD